MKFKQLLEKINKQELENFYSTHTNKETVEKFNINQDALNKLLDEWHIAKKSNNYFSKYFDIITKDKLQSYYILENHSVKDTAKHFNVSNDIILKLISYYDIHKSHRLSSDLSKKVKLGRYGSESYNNREKARSTSLERYGFDNAFKDTNKIKESYINKLGYDHPMKDPIIKNKVLSKLDYAEIQQKALNTKVKNYGSEEAYKAHISEKVIETWKMKSNEDKQSILSKTRQTCLEKYGVEYPSLIQETKFKGNANSKPNLEFCTLLDKNNIEYEREFTIKNRSYDFKVGNILLEINPTFTHNSTYSLHEEAGIDKYYHYNKSKLAKDNGYRCIHIFDWDDKNKIINLLKRREKINARDCIISTTIDKAEIKSYLNNYHLQGYAKSSIDISLIYNNEIAAVMTFGKPRYNKNYEYELIRYCSNKYVIGGEEKLFKYFLNNYNVSSIISYCDNSKFDGKLYTKLGFILKSYGEPSKHWYNSKTKVHITDNLLRQRGFDQLFGKVYGTYGKGTSNEELMKQHGFVELYDAAQSVFIYNKK